jgi:type I restriction enzyme M protein
VYTGGIAMLGVIIGDMVGRPYEFTGKKDYNFPFFNRYCTTTDDSYMTVAVGRALQNCINDLDDIEALKKETIFQMRDIGNRHPDAGWGQSFWRWLSVSPTPYNSYGNGAGMRVSAVGWIADNEEQVKKLSKAVTEISHNHPEGIKGAEAIAMCVYLARIGKSKEEIKQYVIDNYYPEIKGMSYDWLHSSYGLDEMGNWVSCQGSIPQSIVCFLDSTSFEDAVRKAVTLGADTDTQGCMTGAIAEAYYGVPTNMMLAAEDYMPQDVLSLYLAFDQVKKKRVLR